MQESFVRGRINLSPMWRSSGWVLFPASSVDTVSKIREIAIINPEERCFCSTGACQVATTEED
jgi:hypothetical protein